MTSERWKYEAIYSTGSGYGSKCHGLKSMPFVKRALEGREHSVVDVGCGQNNFLKAVREEVPDARTVGVDFACPLADVSADATELPFQDKSFELLTSFDVLEHLMPEEVDAALSEFRRVSRRFIFSIAYFPTQKKGVDLHMTVHSEWWWMRRIIRAGGMKLKVSGRYIIGEWGEPLRINPGSVILVGNGPSVLGSGKGAEIDRHDEVVRFNRYSISGFESDVGTKTTLWACWGNGNGQRESCKPTDETQKPSKILVTHGEPQADFKPYEGIESISLIPNWFYLQFNQQLRYRTANKSGYSEDPGKIIPSSGCLVAAYLLDVMGVEKLSIIGFDHFRKEKSAFHHYWQPGKYFKPKEHDGEAEADIFSELEAAGRIIRL